MKPTANDKARVASLVEKWRGPLFLNLWRVNLFFPEEKWEEVPEDAACAARITHAYFRIHIGLFSEFWEETNASQEYLIVHELSHVFGSELESLVNALISGELVIEQQVTDAAERIAEWITRVAMKEQNGNNTLDSLRRVSRKRGKAR